MYSIAHMVLGLTAAERWAAARRMSPRSVPQQWFVLVGIAVMLVLIVLLVAISYRRHQQSKGQKAERFDGDALRRGLIARERQILLAIAMRSGLRRTHDIFHAIEAFNRGAAQLLAECAQTRTPQENNELKAEVARLRQKLGFQTVSTSPGAAGRAHPSSREIPVGKYIELTGRSEREAVALRAEVLRNDEIEWAVALRTPLESKAGDSWLARYYAGMSAWEFRTSTVKCDGRRLILNHSEEIHFVNRRRFPRVPVRSPGLIARLPFLRTDWAADANPAGYAPLFVESMVTEFAGPGLRIETSLPVQVDERVLVVFRLTDEGGGRAREYTGTAIGRVKHRRDIEQGSSVAVELTGLSDAEIDELASITDELSSRASGNPGNNATGPRETPTYVMTAT